MPKLTSEQAFALAKLFREVANKLSDYQITNFSQLTPAQRTKLEGLEFTVRNYASDFIAISIKIDVADLEPTLASIKGATEKMKKAIQNIKKVNKILKVVTAVVTIGAAVATGNPAAIATAVAGALAEDKKKDEDEKEE
ncbi:MAG: hypothetical protein ACJ754_12385 [Pyrinomonadaceae bacterium]